MDRSIYLFLNQKHLPTLFAFKGTIKINSRVIPNSLEDLGRIPGTSSAICTRTFWTSSAFCPGTLRNLVCYLHRSLPNPLEPHQLSAREPSGTSSAICTGTVRNLVRFLHRNPPEPHQPSAPAPSGTSSAICTGTLRNLISHLRRNPPEPHQPSAPEPSGTHRNPPEPSPELAVAAAPDRTRAILG